ncbi:hypothetical protein GCM10017764_23440 [Sphingobacterium griseoflavum]|uniref:histidine kinase n=2 Tax=Sphingobacterium griseoflavum TaxID=1474952 RepID=A0ABQ3HVS2_9SPHI|nr:hypothetical protein GCM10017764_23440 [Sphingobacterium griseoflavum]
MLFVQQYVAFRKLNKRLLESSNAVHSPSTSVYRLLSSYTEAENLFRLYTINFDKDTYRAYNNSLEEIGKHIDSLSQFPDVYHGMLNKIPLIGEKKYMEHSFSVLRKTIRDLVMLSRDSLLALQNDEQWHIPLAKHSSTDSIVSRILTDTAMQELVTDTILAKKQNLFTRIFKAKADMVISNTMTQHLNSSHIDAIYRHIKHSNDQQQQLYVRKSVQLKNKFKAMLQQEREIVQSNYQLLTNLRNGIHDLEEQELTKNRTQQRNDMVAYQNSTNRFEKQITASLLLMFFMIALILFYQSNAARYERRLREEKAYAAHVAEEKTSILANISHEVRTPVSSLLGIIDMLKRNNNAQVLQQDDLDSAIQEIKLVNSQINDILNLSKLEVGKLDVQYEYFSPLQILTETLNLHRHQAQKKGLQLKKQIAFDEGLEIYSSAVRLKQITSNLLSNAIKYTAKGRVLLTAETKKHKLLVTVSDTGIGIPKEEQEHVFRKYYMGDASKIGGFGLGLYISSLLAKQLGGRISLESQPAAGSSFSLSVPIEKLRLADGCSKPYDFPRIPPGITLVFIDDSRINLMYLSNFAKEIAAQAFFFQNPEKALTFIDENKVDIVVTDLRMPELDGWDVLHHIKKRKKNVKVFLSTGDMIDSEERPRGGHTFDGILKKPLNGREFISKIAESMRAGH